MKSSSSRTGKHKRRRAEPGALVRNLPVLAGILIICLVLAWGIVRSAAVNALAEDQPAKAALIAPSDPKVIAGLADQQMVANMGMVRPELRRSVISALREAPLMQEPFLAAAVERYSARDFPQAKIFLDEDIRRDPRSRLGRLLRLDYRLRMGHAAAAAKDMTIIGRLLPDVSAVFVPQLAKFAQDPQTSAALGESLKSNPSMQQQVLQYLASHSADPALILRLASLQDPTAVGADAPFWQRTLLNRLIAQGQVDRAYAVWTVLARVKPNARAGIYDGKFQGLPGLPPFNWDLAAGDIGAADPEKGGGLDVEYYGRASGLLASQLLLLPQGQYRFAARVEGDISEGEPRLFWRVQCVEGETTLLDLPMMKVTYAGRTLSAAFTVPQGCSAQWLRLAGVATDFPKAENITVREVAVQRVGGAA